MIRNAALDKEAVLRRVDGPRSNFRRIARRIDVLALLGLGALASGCSSAATPPQRPTAPAPTSTTAPPPVATTPPPVEGDPFALDGLVREEWLPLLKGPEPVFAEVAFPDTPKNVPSAPAGTCDAYVKRPTPAKSACKEKTQAVALLDTAMSAADAAARDKKLAELESCAGFSPGLVRSLRIELAPPECGDVLAEPFLKKKPEGVPGAIHHTLIGQALAARLMRTVQSPPKLEAPFTKERVSEFVKGPMMAWFQSQAKAVEDLAKMGAQLSYYGKGIVALAAGTADLRLVDAVRDVPIPDEFKADPDLANAYYSKLDEALDPRKTRGRDGALVGMKEMAFAGILSDARTDATRALLAKLYGGRKVDALDAIVLPRSPDANPTTPIERLAATLPTFYVGLVLDADRGTDPGVLRSLVRRGVPVAMRVALKEKDAGLGVEARALYARIRLAMGIRYWRAEDFDATAALLTKIPKDKLAPDDRLALAIALGLRNGPDDIAALMQKEGTLSPTFGKPRALDVIAAETASAKTQGIAAYDAAVISQIALPRGSEPAQWIALAKRYDEAAPLLDDPKAHMEAQQRARAAEATAKAIAPKTEGAKTPDGSKSADSAKSTAGTAK